MEVFFIFMSPGFPTAVCLLIKAVLFMVNTEFLDGEETFYEICFIFKCFVGFFPYSVYPVRSLGIID